ncbi:MAG: hypothetical protein FWB89_02455 [Treponema sp.]|nr:hypothetical protein [Treponema sp.]
MFTTAVNPDWVDLSGTKKAVRNGCLFFEKNVYSRTLVSAVGSVSASGGISIVIGVIVCAAVTAVIKKTVTIYTRLPKANSLINQQPRRESRTDLELLRKQLSSCCLLGEVPAPTYMHLFWFQYTCA